MEVIIVTDIIIYSLIALLTIFALSQAVNAWTPSQHISVGLMITEDVECNITAFSVGFVSHAATDLFPIQQYRFDLFNPSGNWDIVLLEGFLSAYLLYDNWHDETARWAIIGSLAPDIIDGVLSILDRQRWYDGRHTMPFHRVNDYSQRKNKIETMLFSVIMFQFHW